MMHFYCQLLISLLIIQHAPAANILVISPIRCKSHYFMLSTIAKGLASRGHHITQISHFATQNPNYTEIKLNETLIDYVDSLTIEDTKKVHAFWTNLFRKRDLENTTCHFIFKLNYIRELVHKRDIDLIIVEVYDTLCYHLLAHVLNVPIILVSPPTLRPGNDYYAGNPYNPSCTPLIGMPFTTKMNFWQRLKNAILFFALYWYRTHGYNNHNKEIAKKYFNMELPSEEILRKRTALVLYNNHASFLSRAKSPNVVDVGGLHIEAAKKLPKDLQEFIDQSTHGVILFSFGTVTKASSMSVEKIQIITQVFSMIPQRILWRVDDLNVIQVPANVKLTKWLPQRDVLEHPNVIAFISHCGIQSTFEAISTATPIIAIPFGYDQFQNAKILIEKGVGVFVDYHNMDLITLFSAINDILTPKYAENMRKLSQKFKDRPMSPMNEAVYWIEYVLKHQGATHLRSAAADMPSYKYLSLDVIVFFVVLISCIFYLLKYSLTFAIVFVSRKKLHWR